MSKSHPMIRLFIPDRLMAGQAIRLSDMAAHYIGSVMRQKPGDLISLFNGMDGEWRAQITDISRKTAFLTVESQSRAQKDDPAWPGLTLCFAPVKRAGTDLIIEKATELGVARIIPVITDYTQIARLRDDRLQLIAREAAEQCGRLSLPRIDPPLPLSQLLAARPAPEPLFFCDEAGDTQPLLLAAKRILGTQLRDSEPQGPKPCAVLCGPEGGFSPSEREALRAHQAVQPVGLGRLVLRAETAVIAALSVVGAVLAAADLDDPSGLQ